MNLFSKPLLVVAPVLLLAGAGIGYIAGQKQLFSGGSSSVELQAQIQSLRQELEVARGESQSAISKVAELEKEKASGAFGLADKFKDATMSQIMDAPGPMDRLEAILAKVKDMSEEEVQAELDELSGKLRQGFDMERMFATYMMLTKMGTDDFESALDFLDDKDVIMKTAGSALVMASLASTDPEAALEYFKAEGGDIFYTPQMGGFAAANVARELARHDVSKALEFTKTLPSGAKGEALSAVLRDVVDEDPAKASQIALELPEGKDRTRAINDVTENWAAKDPAAAFGWINGMEEGTEKVEAKKKLLSGWARNDPASAADHLDALVGEDDRGTGVKIVAKRWGEKDPAGAAEWLTDQPDSDSKQDAMRDVVRGYTSVDPEGASVFLAEQPPGESRDAGIQSLTQSIAKSDPIGAITWSTAISDPEKRNFQVKTYTKRWLKEDEPAARKWLETTDVLPIEEKASILTEAAE